MNETLFWIYLLNSIFLINHEIDSAYWEEWKLFRIPGGINTFLLIHFPVLFIVLYGLVLVYQQNYYGLLISLLVSVSGIFAFTAHTFFLLKGRDEFRSTISILILVSTLIISLVQLVYTLLLLF
ncbi:DUF6713 family protein [Methanolobus sp. ZRKC2]|uniref:DUF6713 family protein n=1 Tax=Methanolobus sp. ZRKC2 TaxID=3125783 RepID=UPI003872B0A2